MKEHQSCTMTTYSQPETSWNELYLDSLKNISQETDIFHSTVHSISQTWVHSGMA
jgi:hypothetical protein